MGLTTTLSNALTGLAVTQDSLGVVSRNVSNAGTPGYHQQSISVIDMGANTSTYASSGTVTRAFNQTLQSNYNQQTSQSALADIMASFMDRLQTYLGKAGDSGSLDTTYNDFQSKLQALATTPDDYATRSSFMGSAQTLVSTLNGLSSSIQGMRRDAEGQLASDVSDLNTALKSLEDVNSKLSVLGDDGATRASLMDQRDRLVSQVSGLVDARVDYRSDGTVAIATQSGVGLLDVKRSVLTFQPAGQISASSQFSIDPDQNGVGSLTLTSPSGATIDLVKSNVIRSGEIGGLLALRDKTLVDAQSQIDEIAAGLAQAFSTNRTQGTAAGTAPQTGYSLDLNDIANGGDYAIRNGNDFVVDYTQGGVSKSVRVVRVDDTSKLPLDYTTPGGQRVIGLDFSGGAAGVASALQAAIGPGLSISGSGSTLTVLDDGAAGTTDVIGLTAHTTSTAEQGAGLGLSLFVDSGNTDFTNSLDGKSQKLGFAARISLNSDVVSNNALLTQSVVNGPMGDSARTAQFVDQLGNMRFSAAQTQTKAVPAGALNGTVSDLVSQTINYQGNSVASALSNQDTQKVAMTTLEQRMNTEYGVNIDDEMARLIELQNAYSANARVVSVAQTLIDTLLKA